MVCELDLSKAAQDKTRPPTRLSLLAHPSGIQIGIITTFILLLLCPLYLLESKNLSTQLTYDTDTNNSTSLSAFKVHLHDSPSSCPLLGHPRSSLALSLSVDSAFLSNGRDKPKMPGLLGKRTITRIHCSLDSWVRCGGALCRVRPRPGKFNSLPAAEPTLRRDAFSLALNFSLPGSKFISPRASL